MPITIRSGRGILKSKKPRKTAKGYELVGVGTRCHDRRWQLSFLRISDPINFLFFFVVFRGPLLLLRLLQLPLSEGHAAADVQAEAGVIEVPVEAGAIPISIAQVNLAVAAR
jgi:hypothetical protein